MSEPVAQENEDSTKPWELLYHYTNQEGLRGILESSCIWATDYRFLNDLSERNEALTRFSNANCRQAAREPAIRKYYRGLIQHGLENVLQSVDAYYVSFTKEDVNAQLPLNSQLAGDRLSQWRGYAQGRQGFSLGFNQIRLQRNAEQLHNSATFSIELWDCIYGDEEKEAIVDVVLGSNSIGEMLIKCLARFKHVGFQEEKEWRLVLQVPANETSLDFIKLRDGTFGRTPFIDVPLELKSRDSPLERIVVGPSQYMNQTVRSLEIELEKMGLSGVEVAASRIPYRNW